MCARSFFLLRGIRVRRKKKKYSKTPLRLWPPSWKRAIISVVCLAGERLSTRLLKNKKKVLFCLACVCSRAYASIVPSFSLLGVCLVRQIEVGKVANAAHKQRCARGIDARPRRAVLEGRVRERERGREAKKGNLPVQSSAAETNACHV